MKLRTHIVRGRVVVVAPGPVRERPRGNAFEPTRQRVAARDCWRCARCGRPIDSRLRAPHPMALEVHHVAGVSEFGSDDEANLEPVHGDCHRGPQGGGSPAPAPMGAR